MKALLIANGKVRRPELYSELLMDEYDIVVCADGGANNSTIFKIKPDLVIGDFDSLDTLSLKEVYDDIEMIKYPPEKDKTDTELVLDYLIRMGYRHVDMVGCTGDRIDHTLANVFLLEKLLQKGVSGRIIDEKNCIYIVDKAIDIDDKKGHTLSLLPLTDKVEGVETVGLYYELNGAVMCRNSSFGISNLITSNRARISVERGELLVIFSKD